MFDGVPGDRPDGGDKEEHIDGLIERAKQLLGRDTYRKVFDLGLNVILDDIWAWRADHGNAGTVGWDINTAKNGVIVNGDNVTATGFFVEHYQ